MKKLIMSSLALFAVFTISTVVMAYVGYFIGSIVSVLANVVLGIDAKLIAIIFAWMFVVLTVYMYVHIFISTNAKTELEVVELDADKLEQLRRKL